MDFQQLKPPAPNQDTYSYLDYSDRQPFELRCLLGTFFFLALFISTASLAENSKLRSSSFSVEFEKNRLSVHVKDISLITVLKEVAEQAGIKIILYTPSEIQVSANFRDLTLEEGLKRLTLNYNHALIFVSPGRKKKEQTIKLLIFSKAGSASSSNRTVISPKTLNAPASREPSLSSLLKELEDKDEDVREDAVDELAELRDQAAVAPLSRILQNDEDSDVRASAADALGDIGGPGVIAPLTSALADDDSDVRESAVDSLGQIGSHEVIGPLAEALKDNDADVRASVVDALGQIGGDEAIGFLKEALNDEDKYVQRAARRALKRLGKQDLD